MSTHTISNNSDDILPLKTPFQVQLDKLGRLEVEYRKAQDGAMRIRREMGVCMENLPPHLARDGV